MAVIMNKRNSWLRVLIVFAVILVTQTADRNDQESDELGLFLNTQNSAHHSSGPSSPSSLLGQSKGILVGQREDTLPPKNSPPLVGQSRTTLVGQREDTLPPTRHSPRSQSDQQSQQQDQVHQDQIVAQHRNKLYDPQNTQRKPKAANQPLIVKRKAQLLYDSQLQDQVFQNPVVSQHRNKLYDPQNTQRKPKAANQPLIVKRKAQLLYESQQQIGPNDNEGKPWPKTREQWIIHVNSILRVHKGKILDRALGAYQKFLQN